MLIFFLLLNITNKIHLFLFVNNFIHQFFIIFLLSLYFVYQNIPSIMPPFCFPNLAIINIVTFEFRMADKTITPSSLLLKSSSNSRFVVTSRNKRKSNATTRRDSRSPMVSHCEIVKSTIKAIPKRDPITRATANVLPFTVSPFKCPFIALRAISYLRIPRILGHY